MYTMYMYILHSVECVYICVFVNVYMRMCMSLCVLV